MTELGIIAVVPLPPAFVAALLAGMDGGQWHDAVVDMCICSVADRTVGGVRAREACHVVVPV